MLRSLEKMKKTLLYEYDPCLDVFSPYDTDKFFGEIQAEIDRYYLPRPLFEDGEPVQFGDYIAVSHGRPDNRLCFERIIYYNSGIVRLDIAGYAGRILQTGERLERPQEPDTQDKIDEEAKNLVCRLTGQTPSEVAEEGGGLDEIVGLLERQRKLEGVEK